MSKTPVPWQYCDCDVDKVSVARCGCGHHPLRLGLYTVIHWEGKHWLPLCAFEEAWRRLKEKEHAVRPQPG